MRERNMKIRTTLLMLNIVLIIGVVLLGITSDLNASDLTPTEMMDGHFHQVELTAYCDSGITATGCEVREGICAGAPEWYGCTIAVYDENADFIGYFECLDTGSQPIKEGKVVDLYYDSYSNCIQFGRQTGYIAIIPSEG